MKKIKLSQNKYTIVDDEDYNFLNKYKWSTSKNKNVYYARKRHNNTKITMHRMIMNQDKNKQIDHINGNGLDNRKCNLRICTQSQNLHNARISKRNTSGYKGISWYKKSKKWLVRISVNGKNKHIGYFIDINEAKNSYIKAAKKYHKEFASDGN